MGSFCPTAATTAPVWAFAISVHNCLSALISCSKDILAMSRRRLCTHGGEKLRDPFALTLPAAQSDLIEGKRPPLQTPLKLQSRAAVSLQIGIRCTASLSVCCSSCTTDGKFFAPCKTSWSLEVALLGAIHCTVLVSIILLTASTS